MARFLIVVFNVCLTALALSAHAQQSYPNKPVRLIIPLAPGGTTDITARTLAPQLAAGLGQPVVPENRSGAGGVVGAEVVAKAPPDGYILLLTSSDSYHVNAVMYPKLPFDARKDLKPVTFLAASPNMLSVHPSLPVRSVKDFVARLNKELVRALNTAEVKGRLAAEGSEVIGNTHEQAMATFHRDIEQWMEVIRRTGIKL
jgi:tripartite-type tricarboxylate transporter receptor subunit TctC